MKKLLALCAVMSVFSTTVLADVVPPPVFGGGPAPKIIAPVLQSAPTSSTPKLAAPTPNVLSSAASSPTLSTGAASPGRAAESGASPELSKLNPFTGKPISEEQARKALFSARAQASKLEQVLGEKPLTQSVEGCERPAPGKTAFDKQETKVTKNSASVQKQVTRVRKRAKLAPLTPEFIRPTVPCVQSSTEMALLSVTESTEGLVARFTFRGVEVEALNGSDSPLGLVSVVSEGMIRVGGKVVTNAAFVGPLQTTLR